MKNPLSTNQKPVYVRDAAVEQQRRAELARLTQIEVNKRHSAPQKTVTAIPVRMFEEIPAIEENSGGQALLF